MEVPQGQVNVVDGAVDEDTSVALAVADEETSLVEQVAGLTADHEGLADCLTLEDLGGGITVGVVESARESSHDFELGVGLGCFTYFFAL